MQRRVSFKSNLKRFSTNNGNDLSFNYFEVSNLAILEFHVNAKIWLQMLMKTRKTTQERPWIKIE